MPANTPRGYPYPVGTDRVMDGDDSIKALATAVDTQLGVSASGQNTIPIVAAATPVSVSVTYPAGRFTATPFPVVCPTTASDPSNFHCAVSNATATGFTIWGVRQTGTATFNANWTATQV